LINWKLKSEFKYETLKELEQIAAQLLPLFGNKQIVLMSGPMGSGKTTLVNMISKILGVRESSSPSFAIHQYYQGTNRSIDHLDLFRLENEDELESTGFWDLFSNQEGLIFIEWPEKLQPEQLPWNWSLMKIEIQVSIKANQSEESRVLKLFEKANS
jgi:tRNA threonylcarbamoyladenosine biosynthesis protein TsaE